MSEAGAWVAQGTSANCALPVISGFFLAALECLMPHRIWHAARQHQAQAHARVAPVPGRAAVKAAPRPVAIVLYPFTPATAADIAVALLLQHVAYHTQLGFAKVIQYTQAWRPPAARRLQA